MPTVLGVYASWIAPTFGGSALEPVVYGAYVVFVVLLGAAVLTAVVGTCILLASVPVSMWHQDEPPLVEADMLDITELVPNGSRSAAGTGGVAASRDSTKRTLKVGGTKAD